MTDYEAEYAAFRWDRPERFNFAIDVVDRWAAERPDAPALLHCDDRGNRKVYSWRELAERSVHAALFLRDLGLRPGDGVFTMLPRLAEWWILALGCMRANLVLMPGTTMLTGKDVRYRLELGRARGVVTTAEHLPKFEVGAHAEVIAWISTDEAPTPWVRFRTQTVDGARAAEFPETAADDRMLVYFTSGTTGMPKMVPQTHAELRHRARRHRQVLARPRTGRRPLHPLRHRLGEVRLGKGLRPVEPGRVHGGLRLPRPLRGQGAPRPARAREGLHLLRTTDRVAGHRARRSREVVVPRPPARHQRR
jgi:acyl-CoA synthetase (AMP-forming)/AMP-acid ligase II